MDSQPKPQVIADDVVVILEYSLTVDGQIVDSTEGEEPLQFLQGHQNIIPGLERELAGMSIGQSKTVTVPATEAYGELDPENVIDVPRAEFPTEIPLDLGTELEVKNSDGEVLSAVISAITNDSIKLDFNHPLAGKTLTFDVKVVDLRAPTEEELAHGHVHGEDYDEEFDEEDYDDDFDDEDFDEDELEYEEIDDEEEDGSDTNHRLK